MTQDLLTIFLQVIRKLEGENIPYMIVGSVASMVYGEPRMTHDLDLVVQIHPRDASKMEQMFPIEDYYCPPMEILTPEILRQGQFNLIHHESGLKIDLMIRKNSEHAKIEFERKKRIHLLPDAQAYVASPEDIIIKKLEYFREGGSLKHLQDIRGILAQTQIDLSYLENWITRLGLQKEWTML